MRFTTLSLLALLGVSVLITGCNTVQGAGRDIERIGKEMEDVAN